MKFCPSCGSSVRVAIPDGDNLPRHVCDRCNSIHYQNPKIVAGCIPVWNDKVLMCRRAIEPRYGKWTLPAGFMENGETVAEAAARETMEEAQARVLDLQLYGLFNITHVDQVYVMLRGVLENPGYGPGAESLEVELMTETEIPWDELAFRVVHRTLELFFKERKKGRFHYHMEDISPFRS